MIGFEDFCRLPYLILMDLEFTCWKDSLRTKWANPGRPPEILEVGLVAYSLQRDNVIDTFQSYVKPELNPALSAYCKNLLKISQISIDQSLPLRDVTDQINNWLARLQIPDIPTCSWGEEDRQYWDGDLSRSNCINPFVARYHIDLAFLSYRTLKISTVGPLERERVRKKLRLSKNARRHSALDDALDLTRFCSALKRKELLQAI